MENKEAVIKTKRKRKEVQDRVVLDNKSLDTLKAMKEQIKNQFGETVKVDERKLTNYLIQSRASELSNSELKTIKSKFFDKFKFLKLIETQMIEAEHNGVDLTFEEALKKLETPVVKEKRVSNKPKEAKEKIKNTPSSTYTDNGSNGVM